jgi:hypothetical protein
VQYCIEESSLNYVDLCGNFNIKKTNEFMSGDNRYKKYGVASKSMIPACLWSYSRLFSTKKIGSQEILPEGLIFDILYSLRKTLENS